MTEIRTRFAPSPTGFIHVGNIRSTLFAWLLTKQQDGKLVLRIEDTDQAREVEGSIDHIYESLQWLGLNPDEGPNEGGSFGPYKQSERLDIYKIYAQKLYEAGLAYADPYAPEEVAEFRAKAAQQKKPFLFRDHRPENPPIWDGSMPLRLKTTPKSYTWHDEVRGELSAGEDAVDDFILMKSDGFPTYNFAHIIDDFEMKITHIFRADEFLASMPKFLALYEALEVTPPKFVTLPPIMSDDGRKKLGKRDGAKDLLDYKKDGILQEAMINFLASLGWNDGTEQEIFTANELIEKFSINRIQRGGAKFAAERLIWMNGNHIRMLKPMDLLERCETFLPVAASDFDQNYKLKIIELVQGRLKTLSDVKEITEYFFKEPEINWNLIENNKQLKKLSSDEIINLLEASVDKLRNTEFNPETIQNSLNKLLEDTGQKPGILFSLIRITTTWAQFSPSLPDTLAVLGKEKAIVRLKQAIDYIRNHL